jgi:prepilin-type N-terminal cleavage/methylation domain-containing protein/prepilin-type processing-associated H-X9-DG protein
MFEHKRKPLLSRGAHKVHLEVSEDTDDERAGYTLIEILVALVIISILVGLLLPAIQCVRESARRASCQSNLRNLTIAMRDMQKKYFKPPPANMAGGWSVGILMCIEQKALASELNKNPSLKPGEMSPLASQRPTIMACPGGQNGDSTTAKVPVANYALNRISLCIGDVPMSYRLPWITGPEIDFAAWRGTDGPHRGGFNIARADGSVEFKIND